MHYTVMPRLPLTPEFPVFGLPDSFDGLRWLSGWHPCTSPIAPFPDRPVWSVDLAHGHEDERGRITVHTLHGFRRHAEVALDDWQTGTVAIGGITYPSRTERHRTIIQLPTGGVFVTEHDQAQGARWELVDVSARLKDYVAGRHDLADHEHREAVRQFRVSRGRDWSSLRALLRARGIRLNRAVIADFFFDLPEFEELTDLNRTFVVLVSGDRRVFQFTHATELRNNPPQHKIENWRDITETWNQQPTQFQAQIRWALDYIDAASH